MKRTWSQRISAGSVALCAGVAAIGLAGCEANQIDWRNHSYVVSNAACGTATVKAVNGLGRTGTLTAAVAGTYFGDFNRDGVLDAAVILPCARPGGVRGSEIQVLSRDGAPIQRLTTPPGLSGSSPSFRLGPHDVSVSGGELVTTVADNPSNPLFTGSFTVYRWQWNGRALVPVIDPASVY